MKLFLLVFFLFTLTSCSFDNKSGIWKEETNFGLKTESKKNEIFRNFEEISVLDKPFDKTVIPENNLILGFSKPLTNYTWKETFFNQNNNFNNYNYTNLNQIIFKSKKISKNEVNNYILYENGNAIINDRKGNIIIFSVNQNKIISKFNFYKKKFKNIKKKLNLIVENNIIYVADNLGYLYSYNYITNNIIWAKNYKVPFSSNIKISGNNLILSNLNNGLYFFDKSNGNTLKLTPTEEIKIKNQFNSNLSLINNEDLLFLNTYGSLYSINLSSLKINWFINLNPSLNLLPSNLFQGNILVNNDSAIIASSKNKTFFIDKNSGSIIKILNISSNLKPIINNELAIFLTKNNFLIAVSLKNKNIIYSYDLKKIQELKKVTKNDDLHKEIMILNSEIFVFFKNSQIAIFNLNGVFKEIRKLPSKINTSPISIEKSILYLDNKSKLVVIN